MSKVYFYPIPNNSGHEMVISAVKKLFSVVELGSVFRPKDKCAVKVHFGEKGNKSFIPPSLVGSVVKEVLCYGANCFLTDANTIYRGGRTNAVDHLKTAFDNGFSHENVGVPVLIADGIVGEDYRVMKIDGKHFSSIKVASLVYGCDSMMVISHFKGHLLAGFGGSLKNVGMGLASRSGKQEQHSDVKPRVNKEMCVGCFACQRSCPVMAICVDDGGGVALIDEQRCIGCGECTAACPSGAIAVRWKTDNRTFQEKMIEYAWGILSRFEGRVGFVNFLLNITPQCDCMVNNDTPVVPDLGIVFSLDPVALDRASIDLVNAAESISFSYQGKNCSPLARGEDLFRKIHGVDWSHQLDYAEKLGIGNNKYQLVTLD